MNIQVITIFIIATAILHVILQRMEELKKENDELKNASIFEEEEPEIKPKTVKKAKKNKKTVTIDSIKETRDAELQDIIPEKIVRNYQKNLHLRGIDLLSYTGGVTSAMHSYEDVEKTLDVFKEVIQEMKKREILS